MNNLGGMAPNETFYAYAERVKIYFKIYCPTQTPL